ncbi:MAG: pyruvate, water dikinase [Acetobacteraceae bacterium]|jgi:phosphoenolpyruvate synthase/pyruvate phosphate dikinase|nr:pyruvate, water dikinase [Acetobacteraceae bacterium]
MPAAGQKPQLEEIKKAEARGMITQSGYLRWSGSIGLEDVALVGAKNASLGELYRKRVAQGVRVPNGFTLTADAYRDAIDAAGALSVGVMKMVRSDRASIGSNDLTQLTLGVDRDSEIVAFDFDERDPGMLEMLRLAVTGAKRNGRKVGICGEAPANDPDVARFVTEPGIDPISVNPSSLLRTVGIVRDADASRTLAGTRLLQPQT